MELNGLHQLLVYAADVNLMDENTNTTIYKEALTGASKEGLELYNAKTRCVFMFHQQNAKQNRNKYNANTCKSFGNVAKYLGTTAKKSKLHTAKKLAVFIFFFCLPVCYLKSKDCCIQNS
jgi:hypothetical protein